MTDKTEIDSPKLQIEIQLDSDDPMGLHNFLGELPWFGIVGGWDNFTATIIEEDGSKRDGKEEAYSGEEPVYIEGTDSKPNR